jgi:NhaP-type Na+/H+ or K+/H+ antiporter
MQPEVQVLSVALVGGVAAVAMSRVLRVPAIIPLLLLGISLGPQGLGVMPRPDAVLGRSMNAIVALGVAIILFEGGLSLNLNQLRLAPVAVRNLVTVGAVISFAGASVAAHFLASAPWSVACLYGSLMIVTGPTVIMPLLKSVRVVPRVHTVLLWEGILIDAVGAITAVVTLEIVLEGSGILHVGSSFFGALIVGPILGAVSGYALAKILRYRSLRGQSDEEFDRLLALAGAVGIYAGSEALFKEAGLGAVTCAGLVMGGVLHQEVEELRRFKGVITTLIIGMLFMLLAANFDVNQLLLLWPGGVLTIAALMLIVRPISVTICTHDSKLTEREKLFIAWIGPRGIVAASVASLFSIILKDHGKTAEGDFLLALTFGTILVTVMLNGMTAWLFAYLLGIQARNPTGVLMVGANPLAQLVANIIEQQGYPAILVDTNENLCKSARQKGLRAINCSVLDSERVASEDVAGVGTLLALSSSSVVNVGACRRTARQLDLRHCFSVVTPTTSGEELQVLAALSAGKAFAASIDLGLLFEVLRSDNFRICSVKVGSAPPPGLNSAFLPLVVITRDGVTPHAFDTLPVDGATVIGIQILRPSGKIPFEPDIPMWLVQTPKTLVPEKL